MMAEASQSRQNKFPGNRGMLGSSPPLVTAMKTRRRHNISPSRVLTVKNIPQIVSLKKMGLQRMAVAVSGKGSIMG